MDPLTTALVSGFLGVASNSQSRKASRANRRINALETERRGIQNSLSRRKALAERRRLQASVRAQALAAGVGLSSGADAAEASIDTQVSSELGQQRTLEGIDKARDGEIKRAQKASTNAGVIDAVGQFFG